MEITTALIMLAASLLITVALTPKVKPPPPAAFGDFDFPQSDEGTPQAVYFGECWSGGWMVLAVGNYRTTAITKKGGKK
jgi:hypothetical protein